MGSSNADAGVFNVYSVSVDVEAARAVWKHFKTNISPKRSSRRSPGEAYISRIVGNILLQSHISGRK